MQTYNFITNFVNLNTPIVRLLNNNTNFVRKISSVTDVVGAMVESKIHKLDGYYYLNIYSDRFIAENIIQFNGFFIDFDLDWDLEKIIKEFKPTAIVFSGRGYHLYYLFDIPIVEKPLIYKLGKDILKWNVYLNQQYGIDKKNPLTAMPRLPGTINTKSGKKVKILYTEGKRYTEKSLYSIMQIDNIEIEDKVSVNITDATYAKIIRQLSMFNQLNTKTWVSKILTDTILKKLSHSDGTPDVSRIFFYFIKQAQIQGMSEIFIIKAIIDNELLARQIEKRGGLNKYTLEEIYRIMKMPQKRFNKPILKTTFNNNTIQTLYDGEADKEDFIEFLNRSRSSTVVEKNNVILGKHTNYITYEHIKDNEIARINNIEPLDTFRILKINIDDYIMSKKETVNQKVNLKSKITKLNKSEYYKYEYVVEEYRDIIEKTFNKPLEQIIPYIKPLFYTLPKHILNKLIKAKSNRIFENSIIQDS